MIHTKEELISIINLNQDKIKSFGVNRLGIFGSFVKNNINDNSDIDFLVDFDPTKKTFKNFTKLVDFAETIFGRKVEIVTPQSLSKFIGPFILAETEYVF